MRPSGGGHERGEQDITASVIVASSSSSASGDRRQAVRNTWLSRSAERRGRGARQSRYVTLIWIAQSWATVPLHR
jgi:hypothetical protein